MRPKPNSALLFAALAVLLFTAVRVPAQSAPAYPPQLVPDNPLHPAPPAQPLPYSHKTHLALKIGCQYCHTNPDPGKMMTYPATSICMTCHQSVAKDSPAIKKLAEFDRAHQTIPWVRVYKVMPGVKWGHRFHLGAGLKCQNCHGPVQEMPAMYERTSVTTMGVCISCHEKNHAKTVCSTCHSAPSLQQQVGRSEAGKPGGR
ncbi:MAG TPA: cytochrome c3 family protein [Terriglobales bacterium]|nr:cytochrome c3 family protein [Terriglobales bacterium]